MSQRAGSRIKTAVIACCFGVIICFFGYELYVLRKDMQALRNADTRLADLAPRFKEFKEGIGCEIRYGLQSSRGIALAGAKEYEKARWEYAKAIEKDFKELDSWFQNYVRLGDIYNKSPTGYFYRAEHDQLVARIQANLAHQEDFVCH